MSKENVELVRSYFAAFRGAPIQQILEELDPLLEEFGPDFEVDLSRSISPERGVYRGPREIRGLFREYGEGWSRIEAFETEIIDGGDVIVRVGGFRPTGEYSGLELTAEGASVWTFEEGKPVSMRLYQNKAEALEAAGLAE
jgi:ketosteroid isomerase-like protein